jgi:hypothetical protein
MTEELRQDRSCVFRRGVCSSKYYNHRNLSWVLVSVKIICVALITVHNTLKTDVHVFKDYNFTAKLAHRNTVDRLPILYKFNDLQYI